MSDEKAGNGPTLEEKKAKHARMKQNEAKLLRDIVTQEKPGLKDAIDALAAPVDTLVKLDTDSSKELSATAQKRVASIKTRLATATERRNAQQAKVDDLTAKLAAFGGEEGHEEAVATARTNTLAALATAIETHSSTLEEAGLELEDVLPDATPYVDELIEAADAADPGPADEQETPAEEPEAEAPEEGAGTEETAEEPAAEAPVEEEENKSE